MTEANANLLSQRRLAVLYVEDNLTDAALGKLELERAGYELDFQLAQAPEELQAALAKNFDVVLSDYRLHGWTGLDALNALRQHGHEEPFLLVTGSLGDDVAAECMKMGVADFILKDRMARLPMAVERALKEDAEHKRRVAAEAEARHAHDELEERVRQRTAELSSVNITLRDEVQQRRLAETAVRESEQRFRLMTEAVPGFVWTAGPNGGLDYINHRWYEYTGMWVEQTEGEGWKAAVHPDDVEATTARWQRALESGSNYEAECRIRAADGSYRWYLNRALAMHSPSGEVVKWFGSSTDINDQKVAQQTQAQLAAMREDLVSNVSHALRTPLASLRGFSELMLHRDFPPERQREFIQTIYQESSRLAGLISEFLKLQRMESGRQVFHFESLDLMGLIRERAAFFGGADQRHQIRLEGPVQLPTVKGDLEGLREVLNNLLSNALKYSPAGGDVVIGARVEEKQVVLWVADSGIGMPSHAIPHLFQRFYRVESVESREISGTGLGLAIVKQIVELHHGRVWAESSYGEGSTFFVALPCDAKLKPQTISPSAEIPASDLLIVEDDRAFAGLLREHFEGLGLSVRHTAFAEQALEWCRKALPKVVLLDIHLAGPMDGWDLMLILKGDAALQSIRVFVMVGSDPNVHGLALGGADHVLKSASHEAMLQALHLQLPSFHGKRVLIADDDAIFCKRIARILEAECAEVQTAATGEEALEKIARHMPDLLVLDLLMPETDGFEVLQRLRQERRAVNLRTLVVTGKQLSLSDKAHLGRKMASMVGKSEADLDYFSQVVEQALGLPQPARANEVGA